MASTKSITTKSKKRKRVPKFDDLLQCIDNEPDSYKTAWNELKSRIIELNEHATQAVPPLAPSTLSVYDAYQIFNLHHKKEVLWAEIDILPTPQYLSDGVDRILAVTSRSCSTNEGFFRTIIDQILISAIFEEQHAQAPRKQALSQPENPAVLELQRKTHFQRQVLYGGEDRMLDGFADYTVWYEPPKKANLATSLIVIGAKKKNFTDTCLGQLTAFMGIAHACRKDEQKENSVVYGAASDGLSFRFCRIDNEGNWSQSRLLEFEQGDQGMIYSIFRSIIKTAALSSPSTSPIKNLEQKQKGIRAFRDIERDRKFDLDLGALDLLEEDEETDIISWQ